MTYDPPTALITGATGGLGREIARVFLTHGARIVLTGRDHDALLSLQDELSPDADAVHVVAADLTNPEDRTRLVEQTIAALGTVDVLVNNAGIFEPRPFLDVDEAYLDRFLDLNLKGTYFLTQAIVRHMLPHKSGSIVNVGTVLVDHALAGLPATAPISSKGALHALTRQLAAEFGGDNIRANTLSLGIIRTPMHARNGIDDADSLSGLHLLGRIGEAQEVAHAAWMMATSTFVTGATVPIDGGHIAGHSL